MAAERGMTSTIVNLLVAAAALGLVWQTGGVRTEAMQRVAAPQDGRHRPARGLPDNASGSAAGRGAESPVEIPAKGWAQIGKRVFANISNDRVMAEAAGVTFYALLALFPALAALISLYGLVADPATIENQIAQLNGVVPGGGLDLMKQQVHSLASNGQHALGLGAIIGILVSLWSANGGMKALFDALNVVYEEKEDRSFLRRTLITMAFTLGGLVFVILAMTAIVVIPAMLQFVHLGEVGDLILQLARWPVMLAVIILALALLYRFGPSRKPARWRWITWGSAFAAIVWIGGSAAFSYYVANFGSYNKTYGSLGAAVGFMTWIWISSIIVLVGAELNAEMEHQTERDSTVGPDRPRGERGAVKADRVATA